MEILFTIVIPTYNRANLLQVTLRSLLAQAYVNFEILVVDDGGTDPTREMIIALNDSRVRYFWKENAERGAARNYGARLAKGSYLNFFDSDDLAYDNHLQTAADYIVANPEVIAFHTAYDRKDPQMTAIGRPTVHTGRLNEKVFKQNILSCNNVFIRKAEFDTLQFSEDRKLSCVEDWLLWIRICQRYPLVGLPQVTSTILEHSLRSMHTTTGDEIQRRGNLLRASLEEDAFLHSGGNTILDQATAEMDSLAALYYAIEGKKKQGMTCLFKAIQLQPGIAYSRRTLAIIKYLLIK